MSDGRPVWDPPSVRGRGRLPERVSVAVVGGGVTGVALLRSLPADAVLLEASHLAAGASGRNAGFVLAGVASNYADACDRYGRSLAAEIWSFTTENRERFLEVLGGAAEARRRGSWTVAAGPAEADQLRRSAELLSEDGFPCEWLEHPGGLEPFHGALLNPRDGEVNPAEAVATLAAPVLDRVVEGARVTGVEVGAGRVRLELHGGATLVAEAVVVATNGNTAELLQSVPIEPMRAQMCATVPTAVPLVFRPAYADRGYQYWRQRADGRVLVGGYRNHFVEAERTPSDAPTAEVQALLDRHLDLIGARGLAVSHRWAGVMGFSPDGLPLAGAVPGTAGVYVCGGYTGHGFGFALECARRLAEHVRGGPAPPAWLSPARFAEVPS
jgi:gamma-glutamylputrescine oxidase